MNPIFESDDHIFGRLLDVYLFSIDHEIPGLKLAVLISA
jgi:hypothetical protein